MCAPIFGIIDNKTHICLSTLQKKVLVWDQCNIESLSLSHAVMCVVKYKEGSKNLNRSRANDERMTKWCLSCSDSSWNETQKPHSTESSYEGAQRKFNEFTSNCPPITFLMSHDRCFGRINLVRFQDLACQSKIGESICSAAFPKKAFLACHYHMEQNWL